MTTNTRIVHDPKDKEINPKLYRRITGSLFYLTACRDNILFVVGTYAILYKEVTLNRN